MPLNTSGGNSGFLGGSQIQDWESCQTAGQIGTKFGTGLWIHLGMEMGQNHFAPRYPRAALGGGGCLGGQQFKRLGNVVKRLEGLGIIFAHIIQMNLGIDTG